MKRIKGWSEIAAVVTGAALALATPFYFEDGVRAALRLLVRAAS